MIEKDIFEFGKKIGIPINVPDNPTLGIYVANGPSNKVVGEEDACNLLSKLNYTGPPGMASVIYYALVFMLNNNKWNVSKINEWIEVSAKDTEYFQKTLATKQGLETKVKEGLTSAAASLADYEMVQHDLRKYKQMVNYYYEKDEHMLKSMFIDQVDIHNGPLSMVQLGSRWPTLISDFQKLTDEDNEPSKIQKKLKISEAEAMLLTTKNKLYSTWKKTFKNTVVSRYETLVGLARSKEKSIDEYRNWLKPYIARYKMTKLGSESVGGRAAVFKSFADISASSTFTNGIQLWAYKPLAPIDVKHREIKKEGKFIIYPYDSWIREHFILDDKKGLANIYPWLKNERGYCSKCKKYQDMNNRCKCGGFIEKRYVADEIVETEILPTWEAKENNLDPKESYYSFMVIDVFRAGSKLPVGEIEDITFSVYSYMISHNVLLVKLLELKCREREFELYIDEILGVRRGEDDIKGIIEKDFPNLMKEPKKESELEKITTDLRKMGGQFSSMFKSKPKVPGGFMFSKPGQYESDFKDRIPKFYLNPNGKDLASITEFLKSKMGVN
ncbi:MAG: hypothetical protein KJ906_00435 [Nanoarchaeota archaeon]|nr:hypothetical protein [Nanoarchaeota archaeon]